MKDIALHGKGLEQSEYVGKESLAQQGGYYLTNKGPQHDEAWLIFMDMVNNRIPTFEDKAEALHYFPMFRTWFGLQGLCKLPWNDVEPSDNAKHAEPNKVPEHVHNYYELYTAITGETLDWDGLIRQSERVYNFQRVFNLRQGHGLRQDDYPPYRAMGPVLEDEYLAREERYDKQMKEKIGVDPAGKITSRKGEDHPRIPPQAVRQPDRRGVQAPRLDLPGRAYPRAPEDSWAWICPKCSRWSRNTCNPTTGRLAPTYMKEAACKRSLLFLGGRPSRPGRPGGRALRR